MPRLKVLQGKDEQNGGGDACDRREYDFAQFLKNNDITLKPSNLSTLQVNVTKLCNQACVHCHVDSGPKRKEQIDKRTVDRCLEILAEHESIEVLDLTGGAPELNPHFDYFVESARALGRRVMVRHNLTVTFDGNPQTGESKRYLPEFFAKHEVEVVSSLPYYQEYFTDKQRGDGVFKKSIAALKLLNDVGYGVCDSGLLLNLVYNPIGAYLPPEQKSLEEKYRQELRSKFEIEFNELFTITNMPIHRFKIQLKRMGGYEDYMNKLVNAFNPHAVESLMCRSMLSVSHDGRVYDCDFNQMLGMHLGGDEPLTVFNLNVSQLLERQILFDSHCFGCTAGSGSSCGGSLVAA